MLFERLIIKRDSLQVTLESAERYSAATCVLDRIDLAPCDSDYRISSSFSHLMTK